MDDEYDALKFHEHQVSLMERLAEKFVVRGFARPSDFDLRRIATLNHLIDPSTLVQDTGRAMDGRPNTRKPVEQLLKALNQVIECYAECETIAEIESPPGRLNIANEFIENAQGLHPLHYSAIFSLHRIAEETLRSGVIPSKREPLLAYDGFIFRVRSACGETVPANRGAFIALLFDCEFVLPASLRGRTKAVIGDRLDAYANRVPVREQEAEQEAQRLRQEARGELGAIGLPGFDATEV